MLGVELLLSRSNGEPAEMGLRYNQLEEDPKATPEHNVFKSPLWPGISSEFLEELEDAAKGKGDWSLLCCSCCSGDPAKFVKLYTSLNPWSIFPLLNLLLLFQVLCSVRAHLY